jgi:hypothetical protein
VERISYSPAVAFSKQQLPLIVPVLTPEFNVFELSILRVVKVPRFCEVDEEF